MNYESLQLLSAAAFRRSVGIDRHLFTQLVETLAQAERLKKKLGRPSLSPENQLCMTLSYWRECRTFFHLGVSYGVHESNAYRIVNRVESRLAASGLLALVKPEAVSSLPNPVSGECSVILDASEVRRERPQKTKPPVTAEKSTLTRSNSSA